MRFFDPIARSALTDGSALRLFPTSSSSSSSSVLAEYPADDAETSSRADRDSAAARCARMYAVDPGSGGRFALMYAVDPGSGGGGIGGERSSPGGGVASASASPSADSLEGPRSRSTSSNFTRDALSRGLETGSGGGVASAIVLPTPGVRAGVAARSDDKSSVGRGGADASIALIALNSPLAIVLIGGRAGCGENDRGGGTGGDSGGDGSSWGRSTRSIARGPYLFGPTSTVDRSSFGIPGGGGVDGTGASSSG